MPENGGKVRRWWRPRPALSHPAGIRRFAGRVLLVMFALVATLTAASAVYNHATATPSVMPPLDSHGHEVRTGDFSTHFQAWGTTGSAVVLVHGFAESAQVFDALGPLLAATHHRVYALAVRGYGFTERRGPYNLASDTDQLADFLQVMHLRRADGASTVLVGHSSGAAIVGDLALTRPTYAAGIVFLDGDGTPYGAGRASCPARSTRSSAKS